LLPRKAVFSQVRAGHRNLKVSCIAETKPIYNLYQEMMSRPYFHGIFQQQVINITAGRNILFSIAGLIFNHFA
jgi:hypothetical protein